MHWFIEGGGLATLVVAGVWVVHTWRLRRDCDRVMSRLEAAACRFGIHQLAYDLHLTDHRASSVVRWAVVHGKLACRRLPDGSFGIYR